MRIVAAVITFPYQPRWRALSERDNLVALNTPPNIPDPDGVYADLLGAHEGLSDDESITLNARLILVLAKHIGDRAVLRLALTAAADAEASG